MTKAKNRNHKHVQLDSVKTKHAQQGLRVKTKTDNVESALDLEIAEHESNRLALEVNERFLKSGVEIKDVYGKLDR